MHRIEVSDLDVNVEVDGLDGEPDDVVGVEKTDNPNIAVDDDHDDPSVLAPASGDLLPSQENSISSTWGGQKWFPGCFPEDGRKHIMRIGVAADIEASKATPSQRSKASSLT